MWCTHASGITNTHLHFTTLRRAHSWGDRVCFFSPSICVIYSNLPTSKTDYLLPFKRLLRASAISICIPECRDRQTHNHRVNFYFYAKQTYVHYILYYITRELPPALWAGFPRSSLSARSVFVCPAFGQKCRAPATCASNAQNKHTCVCVCVPQPPSSMPTHHTRHTTAGILHTKCGGDERVHLAERSCS